MDTTWSPWNDYPGLTLDRLKTIAELLAEARDTAAESHAPSEGESAWSLGTRAYERSCAAVARGSSVYPWLAVESGAGGGPKQFVFSAAGHPVRFFHGAPDDMPMRYQQMTFAELLRRQENLMLDGLDLTTLFLRIGVVTNSAGKTQEVILAEFDGSDRAEPSARRTFTIPRIARNVVGMIQPLEPAATLPPVVAELPDVEQGLEQDEVRPRTLRTGSDDN